MWSRTTCARTPGKFVRNTGFPATTEAYRIRTCLIWGPELAFWTSPKYFSYTYRSFRALAIADLLRTELSNFSVHTNHLEILLTMRFWFSWLGAGGELRLCQMLQTLLVHSPHLQSQGCKTFHPDCSSLSAILHALEFISRLLLLAQVCCIL